MLEKVKHCLLRTLVLVIYVVSHVYDYLSYPLYMIYYHPWRVRRYGRGNHAQKEIRSDGEIIYYSTTTPGAMSVKIRENNIDTMLKAYDWAVRQNSDRDCLGTRQFLSEGDEIQPNGKVFKKYNLGQYQFITYGDVSKMAEDGARGLLQLGLPEKSRVAILAETRMEWMTLAYSCFKNNFTIVTLYTNLGEDGVIHGIEETQVPVVICSAETLPKLKKVLPSTPSVSCIVVMEDMTQKPLDLSGLKVKSLAFKDLIEMGKNNYDLSLPPPPTPEDHAIIMYTSGSTGKPKGVVISHRNLITGVDSLVNIADFRARDRYIGYLPLAHVLELLAEMCCLMHGCKIGYSSSQTLTNKSSKIMTGTKGDANVLRPTLMSSVPLILERIYKSVVDTMRRQGWAAEELFHYFVQYKMKWQNRGFDTPLLNKTLFRKIRYFLGGRVRLMLSGGAPLSPDTHELTRTVICVPLLQGYGLTETAACATVTNKHDRTTSRAGAPLMNTKIKLVDWVDGNYLITDKPNPRGEIHIGGNNVAVGYYKNAEKTSEEFYTDSDGIRWFKTGDIGEMDADGVLQIIDRKKDLVKLQHGEYISYGKVESVLKTCPIVENICTYADPTKDYLFAVIIPDKIHLSEMTNLQINEAIKDPQVIKEIIQKVSAYGFKNGLTRTEVPGKILLTKDEWTPESGLVTAAFKIRRRFVVEEYKDQMKKIYV